jgi:hypothetical protein
VTVDEEVAKAEGRNRGEHRVAPQLADDAAQAEDERDRRDLVVPGEGDGGADRVGNVFQDLEPESDDGDAARGELVDRAGSGALRVIVDTTLPLAGHAPGRLVLIP